MRKILFLFLMSVLLIGCTAKNNKYNVFFETYGYVDNPQTVYDVSSLSELPILSKDGYIFIGWYYDSSYNSKASDGDVLKSDVILYAKWEKDVVKYNVSFNALGVIANPAGVKWDKIIELPSLSCDGYYFVGWYYNSSFTKEVKLNDVLTGDVTLYAKWLKDETGSFDTPIIPGK